MPIRNIVPPTTTVGNIAYSAALSIGAVQMGEPLTGAESAEILSTWQRLIDSLALDRANIHTIRQDTYSLIGSLQTYTLGYDPTAPSLTISAATNAATVTLTLSAPHGIPLGRQNSVYIQFGGGNWQAINGGFIATSLGTTTLSIPVNSTSFGALTGSPSPSLQIAGTWNFVRPSKIKTINLIYSSGVSTPIYNVDDEQWADISYQAVNGPPLKAYVDSEAPITVVRMYPVPDINYQVVVFSEELLEQVINLSDVVTFAQGYQRYHTLKLAVEIAPAFAKEPSPTLMANLAEAESLVKGRNRRSPALKTDPNLTPANTSLYNYRLGMST